MPDPGVAGDAPGTSAAGEVLTVRLAGGIAGELLALPAAMVREVLRPTPLTRVPQAPASLLGLSNLRGTVLPVLSLAAMMGREAAAPSPATRVVVMEGATTFGLLVDAVASLGRARDARSVDLPALLARDFGGPAHGARRASAPNPTAAEADVERAGPETLSLLAFGIAGQDYALPLDGVAEVARLPAEVTSLPEADSAMLGVVPFRGGLLPLASLHALLGLPATARTEHARIVVTRLGTARVGLVVDAMKAILRVPHAALDPVPPVLTRGRGEARVEAIARIEDGRRLVSILSPARLFDDETTARLHADASGETKGMDATGTGADAVERFVVFRLGEEHYGLPIAAVDEVVRRPATLTRIPRAPEFVAGAMNLRGTVLPVIDQRRRFGSAGEGDGKGGRIVVVTIDGLRAGFAVDAVSEVLPVAASDLSPAPDLAGGATRVFDRVARVERGGRMILLIDPRALLDAAERDLLAAIAAPAKAAP